MWRPGGAKGLYYLMNLFMLIISIKRSENVKLLLKISCRVQNIYLHCFKDSCLFGSVSQFSMSCNQGMVLARIYKLVQKIGKCKLFGCPIFQGRPHYINIHSLVFTYWGKA